MLVLPAWSGACQDPDLLSPAEEGKEPCYPTQPEGSRYRPGTEADLCLCCTESQAGNRLFLKSTRALLLSFRETVLEAQQGREHVLQIESKSTMAKVVAYTAG